MTNQELADHRKTHQTALEGAGVPSDLAKQCADIFHRDDATLPNLGRTQEDQDIINQARQYIITHTP